MAATHSYGSTRKQHCLSTIQLEHQKETATPIGPARKGGDNVEHQCSGPGNREHIHYCGCGVEWNAYGVVTSAPWLKEQG